MKTNDPVWDAEQAQKDPRPIIAYCEYCGRDIRGETDFYDPDDAYNDGRIYFCEDCVGEYLKQYKI